MKILICGSRDVDEQEVLAALCKLTLELSNHIVDLHDMEIILGGARGVDKIAEKWFRDAGVPIKVFTANWEEYGRRAGILRNIKMLNYLGDSGMVVAIHNGDSPGTAFVIKEAKSRNLQLKILKVNSGKL